MSTFKDIFKVVGNEAEAPMPEGGDIKEVIGQDVANNKVVLYMKGTPDFPQCGFSASTVEMLNEIGVPYEARNVLADPALRQGIKEFSNWPTIPQLYVGGKFIGGCDIVTEMHQRGELAPLVQEASKS